MYSRCIVVSSLVSIFENLFLYIDCSTAAKLPVSCCILHRIRITAVHLAVLDPLGVRRPDQRVLVAEAQLPEADHEVYAQEQQDGLHRNVHAAEGRVVLVAET